MVRRPLDELHYIVVHHSVTPEYYTVEDIRRIHLRKGFSDIGYHYLITKDGLQVGRPIIYRGAHALSEKKPFLGIDMNRVGIGLCIIGNFTYEPPSDRLVNETAYVIHRLCRKYKIKGDRNHIIGHREVSYTACPGPFTMAKIYEKLGI